MDRVFVLFFSALFAMQWSFGEAHSQTVSGNIRSGNRAYRKGEYKSAELAYRKAQEIDSASMKIRYNLAASLYKQQRYDEAEKKYSQLAQEQGQEGSTLSQDAAYNAANSLFKEGKYDKSAELYKQVLRINPRDEAARYNLSEALRRIAQQKREQQSQKDKEQGKDKQEQQNQDNSGGQKKGDSKEQQQGKEQQGKEQQGQQGSGAHQGQQERTDGKTPQGQPMREADARRILRALEKQQGKASEKVRKANQKGGSPRRSEKDW